MSINFRSARFLFPLLAILLLAVAPAQAGEVSQRLDRFVSDLETLQADFHQTVRNERGEVVQNTAGEVSLYRPGRFRWHYQRPYEQLILADGDYLWIYDVDLDQASRKPLNDSLANAPIMLLMDNRPLAEDFDISEIGRQGELDWLLLEPKVKDSDFQSIRLGMDGETLASMVLQDAFGQQTRIDFHQLQYNPDLDAETFRFTPPPGVDVVTSE